MSGLLERGCLFKKSQDQGYKKLARYVEERTGQGSFDSHVLTLK